MTCHARHHDDGAKKVNGRKRHLLIDTLGLIGKVQVTAADVGDPRRCHGAAGPVGPAAVPSATTWLGRRRRPRPLSGLHAPAPGIAFQVVQRHDGGRKPRWLPPGATPSIVSLFATVPGGEWWSGPSAGWVGFVGSARTTSSCQQPRRR